MPQKILVADDDFSLRSALTRIFTCHGFQVITASSIQDAERVIASHPETSLALVDLKLPDGSGIDLLSKIKFSHSHIPVIILTGFGTVEAAVQATQKGAFHFVTKPFNMEELISLVKKALEQTSLQKENSQLRNQLRGRFKFDEIIGQSPNIEKVLRLVDRVADTDSTVLITGESGTGKELIAKAIHYNSTRVEKPLVPINCGAIPGDLLESELFGHVKGAFTGAIANRLGRFQLAEGGTIFLDEIGDMSPNLQVKLLRVLQERRFEPVGGTKTIEVDVRVIAATNSNLEKSVEQGRFREDLFYRLNVIPVSVPPLRQRQSDIPLLFHHFMQNFNSSKNRQLKGISQEAMHMLLSYSWPGNIRELENLVERLAIIKGEGIVQIEDLPVKLGRPATSKLEINREMVFPDHGMDFNSAVDSFENSLILKALEKTGWNRNQAAILLKLNRTTLVEKIKKKGLKPDNQVET